MQPAWVGLNAFDPWRCSPSEQEGVCPPMEVDENEESSHVCS